MATRSRTLMSRYLRDGGPGANPTPGSGPGGGGQQPQQQPGQPTGAPQGGAPQGGAIPPAGAPQQGQQQPGQPNPASGQQPGAGDQPLGEGGYRALQSERELRATAEQQLAAARQELQQLRQAGQTDQERALDAARQEGRTEAATAANAMLIRAEVRAAAATAGFADPMDAAAHLGERFPSVAVTPQGTVDQAAVTAMVAELAQAKPYLLRAQQPPAFAPNPGQGATPAGTSAPSLEAGAALYKSPFPAKT